MIFANQVGLRGEDWFVGPWNSEVPASLSFGGHIGRETHVHDEMFEIYLVAQGSARLVVESVTYELRAGNIAVVEPGEVHVMLDGTEDYRHFVVQTPFVHGDKRLIASTGDG